MSTSPISTLPPEVLHQALKYLAITTLLKFAQTSKKNYSAAILALQNLRLAIFPRHIYGVLAFLSSSTIEDIDADFPDSTYDNPCRNQVIITSPLPTPLNGPPRSRTRSSRDPSLTPVQHREKLFQLQNALACSILSTPTLANLSQLTLHIYHITSPFLAEILATLLPNLRDLRLNFCHPYLHDPCLPGQYWTNPAYLQPSPIWNALAGVGEEGKVNLKLRKLEKLTLERAGITSFQLQKWVECNPALRDLNLRNVAGVDLEFVQWLGRYCGDESVEKSRSDMAKPAKLKTLALENCSTLSIQSVEELSWLDCLFDIVGKEAQDHDKPSTLHVLSFRDSASVSTTALLAYLESRRPALRQVTLPDGRILVPKSHKRSHSQLSAQPEYYSGHGNNKKRQREIQTRTTQSSSHSQDDDDNHANGAIEPNTVDMGIQTLSIDENQQENDDDSEDDDSASLSPVSYLRTLNRCNIRKGCKFMSDDIIEPDPDAS